MNLSVEIEPPKGIFIREDEENSPLYQEIINYVYYVDMISITNRPVFGLSPLTLASQIQKMVNELTKRDIRINLHLTTRLSHFDTFKTVLDAHRVGLSDLLPILGDPRGPNDDNYFKNGLEILGFISFLKTGKTDYLSEKYLRLFDQDILYGPIENASFTVGSVVDVNPVRKLQSGNETNIREKQIRLARTKERLGAEYLISQAVYDASSYFEFVDAAGLDIPILAGVMPARTKLLNMFGLPINSLDRQRLRAAMTTEEERIIGNQIGHRIYEDLLEGGCESIHIYSIGNYENFQTITGYELEEEILQTHIDDEGDKTK